MLKIHWKSNCLCNMMPRNTQRPYGLLQFYKHVEQRERKNILMVWLLTSRTEVHLCILTFIIKVLFPESHQKHVHNSKSEWWLHIVTPTS